METQMREILSTFECFQLEASGEPTLMDRTDTKFIVHITDIPDLLEAARHDFLALDIDNTRCFEYENIYYDTQDLQFYTQHHHNRMNRYKVRVRNYVNSGTQFLEIKFKNNKKRTLKNRIKLQANYDKTLAPYRDFMCEYGISKNLDILPSQCCRYDRVALASKNQQERITIDINVRTNLLCIKPMHQCKLNEIAIVELKQYRSNRSSAFFHLLRKKQIRPANISKYCMGFMEAANINPDVKFNRFKPIIRRVNDVQSQH